MGEGSRGWGKTKRMGDKNSSEWEIIATKPPTIIKEQSEKYLLL